MRNRVAEWLRAPVTQLITADNVAQRKGTLFPSAASPDTAAAMLLNDEYQRISTAQLYSVTADMTDLALHGSATLPDAALTPDARPSETALLVYDTPIGYSHTSSDLQFPIVACSWGPSPPWTGGHGLWVTFWSHTPTRSEATNAPDDAPSAHEARLLRSMQPGIIWDQEAMIGGPGELFTQHSTDTGQVSDVRLLDQPHTREWLRVLVATWLLITQYSDTAVEAAYPPRPVQRDTRRRGHYNAPVRVVSVHKPQRRRTETGAPGSPDDRQPNDPTHDNEYKTPVSFHWRHQAYGPQWSKHRWIPIRDHHRGPEDAPIRPPRTVRKLDRPPRPSTSSHRDS